MPRINIPAMLGSAAATFGLGKYAMRDKETPSAASAQTPASVPAPAKPSAAMQAKPRVRPASEGVPESAAMRAKPRVRPGAEGLPPPPAKSETRKQFEKEFLAARRRGDVEFMFRGRPISTRRADETGEKHRERMKEAAAQQRLDERLDRYRARKGGT